MCKSGPNAKIYRHPACVCSFWIKQFTYEKCKMWMLKSQLWTIWVIFLFYLRSTVYVLKHLIHTRILSIFSLYCTLWCKNAKFKCLHTLQFSLKTVCHFYTLSNIFQILPSSGQNLFIRWSTSIFNMLRSRSAIRSATSARRTWLLNCYHQDPEKLANLTSTYAHGEHKRVYHPAQDVGDNVILINTRHIKVAGNMWEEKTIYENNARSRSAIRLPWREAHLQELKKNQCWKNHRGSIFL